MNIGQEQYKKTFIKLKARGAKFHKSSKTFWEIATLQPKNRQTSAAVLRITLFKLILLSRKFEINYFP